MRISSHTLYVYLLNPWYIYKTYTVLNPDDISWYIVCLFQTFLIHVQCSRWRWYDRIHCLSMYDVLHHDDIIWYTVCLSHTYPSDTRYVSLIWYTVCLSHTHGMSISYIWYTVCLSHTFLIHIQGIHCIRSSGHHRIHCTSISYILDTYTRRTLYAMMMTSSDAL